MKKNIFLLSILLTLTSCNTVTTKLNIIAPEGTPSLGLSNFYIENSDTFNTFDIKGGSDPLVAAFNSDKYDIIVAPTNLGVKFLLYKIW